MKSNTQGPRLLGAFSFAVPLLRQCGAVAARIRMAVGTASTDSHQTPQPITTPPRAMAALARLIRVHRGRNGGKGTNLLVMEAMAGMSKHYPCQYRKHLHGYAL